MMFFLLVYNGCDILHLKEMLIIYEREKKKLCDLKFLGPLSIFSKKLFIVGVFALGEFVARSFRSRGFLSFIYIYIYQKYEMMINRLRQNVLCLQS